MIGPRDSVVRMLRGEDVSLDEILTDRSEFIDSDTIPFLELGELWIDQIHDYVHIDD